MISMIKMFDKEENQTISPSQLEAVDQKAFTEWLDLYKFSYQ